MTAEIYVITPRALKMRFNHTFSISAPDVPPSALFKCPCGYYLAAKRAGRYGASVKVCNGCQAWHSILWVDVVEYWQLAL